MFDQFEEIFTLGRAGDFNLNRTRSMIAELADLVENRTPDDLSARFESDPESAKSFDFGKQNHKIIFSLREDYLPHLESLQEQIRSIRRNRLRLTRMNGVQAMQVVIEPGGDLIDEGFVQPSGAVRGRRGREAIPPEMPENELADLEVEPALLSVVCRELNNKRLEQNQDRITLDLLAGSKSEIIKDFYERSGGGPAGVGACIDRGTPFDALRYRDSVALEDVFEFEGATRPSSTPWSIAGCSAWKTGSALQRVELTHDF